MAATLEKIKDLRVGDYWLRTSNQLIAKIVLLLMNVELITTYDIDLDFKFFGEETTN